jgi:NO-binding membrane sensor protein with MHYT domain/CheY-like chemotaxis protein
VLLKVLSCLSQEHDIRLVALAGVICLLSTGTAFGLYAHARAHAGSRWLWLTAGAVAAGSGVWATHFIGMLAYQPNLKTGYEPLLTVASWLIAVLGLGISLGAGMARPTIIARLGAGAALGLWVGVMHFVGMSAMRTEGVLHWDLGPVVAAVVLGASLGALSLAVAGDAGKLSRQAAGAVVATLAVCALHFTAMAAVTITPDPSVPVPPMLLSASLMAVVLAVIIGVIVLAAAAAVLLEQSTRRQAFDALTEAAERLAAARDEAEAANRSRTEFLTAMSHELRTPLNGVRGMIQALGATAMTPDQRDMLRALDASAHTLQRELASLFTAADANAAWSSIERTALTPPPPELEPEAAPAPAEAAPKPLHILIAEDHPVNRKVLSLILSTVDPEITFAETGVEAVDAFRPGAFDIVFMDMQMPVMDGLEATRSLRRMEQEAGAVSTPVVMLTAHALPEHARASADAGADRHLTKPVSAADVMAVLQEFCGPQAKPRPQAA